MNESKYTIAARKRWIGVSDEKRSSIMRLKAIIRWSNVSKVERKKIGEQLKNSRSK